jgi:hypothetical protein
MGVALATLLVSAVLAVAIATASWFVLVRRLRSATARVLIMLGVVGIAGLGLLAPVGSFLWFKTVRQCVQVPLKEYRAIQPALPATVNQVTYYSAYSGTEALFAIAENDLARWAKSNDWSVAEITCPELVELTHLNVDTAIVHGVVIEQTFYPRGTVVRAVFNRDTGVCFVQYSSY